MQDRLRDPTLDISQFVAQILKSSEETEASPKHGVGSLLAKVNQDITWDVSGIIGMIVTIVLMMMVVSRSYADMPKEIIAGWTTILGFYFGKATK